MFQVVNLENIDEYKEKNESHNWFHRLTIILSRL